MTLPRPYQADADGDQAAESAHDRLPLHELMTTCSTASAAETPIVRLRLLVTTNNTTNNTPGSIDSMTPRGPPMASMTGEVLPLARGGEGRHTRTFLLVLIGHARSLAPGVERGIRQRTSENIGPRDSVVLTSVC